MTREEIVNRAIADYEGWGPTPAWPTVGGWVVAMLDSFGGIIEIEPAAVSLPVEEQQP